MGRWSRGRRNRTRAGFVQRVGDDYVGLEIHLAARIAAAANGGQILISAATRRAVGEAVATVDLGKHRLKDFPEPERLYHVVAGEEAPPMPRGERLRPTNLPSQPSRMIGRDAERSSLAELLVNGSGPIVSLTGIGGIGKTRLAIAVGHELLELFPGGVFIVRLAGIADPDAVLPAIAEAAGIETENLPPLRSIAQRLGERPTLIILDNFEQLLSAAQLLMNLATEAETLRMLVTTQAPLRIGGERTFPLHRLDQAAAIELFIERARERIGEFRPDARERTRIAAICNGLDLLPLAIELAAARVAVLSLEELERRLERPLAVLTRGSRDLPERQRTLRATFEWTHALLTPPSRRLFARLGVCAGAVPLSTVEEIAASGDRREDAIDQLDELLEFSLVRRQEDRRVGLRFLIPQALRAFALERLVDCGEEANTRRCHARHLASLAHASRSRLFGGRREEWAHLHAIADEIRPAMVWTRVHDPELHVSLCAGLAYYWRARAPLYEVMDELCLARNAGVGSPQDQAWVATHLAGLHALMGARKESLAFAHGAIARWRDIADELERGRGLCAVTWAYRSFSQLTQAVAITEEALALFRRQGDRGLLLHGLYLLAQCLIESGQIERAGVALEEVAQLTEGDPKLTLATIWGDFALARGEYARAAAMFADSLAEANEIDNPLQVLLDLRSLTICLARPGSASAALEMHEITRLLEEELGRADDTEIWATLYTEAVIRARDLVEAADASSMRQRVRALTPERRVARAIELAAAAGQLTTTGSS